MPTRIVSFGGSSVRIDYDGPDTERVVDFLYRDLARDGRTPPHVIFSLQRKHETFILRCGREHRYEGTSAAVAAAILLDASIFHLADQSRDGVLLHAGAVRCSGGCLMLPGKTGAGKTTLTAWLTTQGFGYLTDELVHLPLGSLGVQFLKRPLNVKAHGRQALAAAIDFGRADTVLAGPNITLVRPPQCDPHPESSAALPLARLVFPRYDGVGPFQLMPLTKAQAALRLTECLINARNLPAHGFHEVARISRAAPAYDLRYSAFDQLDAWVASLADAVG